YPEFVQTLDAPPNGGCIVYDRDPVSSVGCVRPILDWRNTYGSGRIHPQPRLALAALHLDAEESQAVGGPALVTIDRVASRQPGGALFIPGPALRRIAERFVGRGDPHELRLVPARAVRVPAQA